jgi:hypothetical protein
MADAPESRAQQMARQRAYGQDFLRLYRRAGSLKRWRAQFPPTEAEKELGKLRLAEWQRRPGSIFPQEPQPDCGYWVGKTVATRNGGTEDVGIKCQGDDYIFTRPKEEVAQWLIL